MIVVMKRQRRGCCVFESTERTGVGGLLGGKWDGWVTDERPFLILWPYCIASETWSWCQPVQDAVCVVLGLTYIQTMNGPQWSYYGPRFSVCLPPRFLHSHSAIPSHSPPVKPGVGVGTF